MSLSAGTPAPDFEAAVWNGDQVKLADYRGKKLWLAFFRYASCPLCNLRVRDIINRHEELSGKGMEVLAVFQSPPESIAKYVGKQEPPFPLVSDPEEKLYKLYELETSLGGFMSLKNVGRLKEAMAAGFKPGKPEGSIQRIPGDFLIDAEGVIQDAYYGEVIADHIPFERVEAFVK